MTAATPTILVADDHPLFREALKGAVAKLLWSGPGIAKQVVPQARLYP